MKHPEMSALLLSGLLALGVAGCSVTREQSTVGQYVDDATVTARVKAKFAEDPTVSAMSTGVETPTGVAHLSGFAKSAAEKMTAENIARGVNGVRLVKNEIAVRP